MILYPTRTTTCWRKSDQQSATCEECGNVWLISYSCFCVRCFRVRNSAYNMTKLSKEQRRAAALPSIKQGARKAKTGRWLGGETKTIKFKDGRSFMQDFGGRWW